jgi:peroxiredoxin
MDFHQLIIDEHQSYGAAVPIDLRCGHLFPEFLLPDESGFLVWSRELLAQGPFFLFYFHGGWCDVCDDRLKRLNDMRHVFYKMGVSVVAVSPETGGSPRELKQLHDLNISILSDVDHALAKELDFAFPASRPLLSRISAAGVDLAERFGSHTGILPASASFAIDRDGTMLAGSIESADRFDFFADVFREVTLQHYSIRCPGDPA